jgi:Family of unknown function (DUF5832)
MSETKFVQLQDLLKALETKGITVIDQPNTSLTAPKDALVDLPPTDEKRKKRDKKNRRVKLSGDQLDDALEKLVRSYPPVEKRWADPVLAGQLFCSVSFVPARGAKPDDDGLFGLLKVRGTFATEEERDCRAEMIINDVDSYHAITHGHVGQPLPITYDDDDRYALDVTNVALKKKIQETLTADMVERKEKERKDLDEAKARSKEMEKKQDTATQQLEDNAEKYTALRVKRSNMIFAIYEMMKKLKQYKDTLTQTIHVIEKMDKEYPQFQTEFIDRYNSAAAKAGISSKSNPIVRFLVGPVPFDMGVIPDSLPVIDMPEPQITFFDAESIVPRSTANDILNAGGKDGFQKPPKTLFELEAKRIVVPSRPTIAEQEIELAKKEIEEEKESREAARELAQRVSDSIAKEKESKEAN